MIMHAYGRLTHYLPSFACYTESRPGCRQQHLSRGRVFGRPVHVRPGKRDDPGAPEMDLSNGLGPIGLGSMSDFSHARHWGQRIRPTD